MVFMEYRGWKLEILKYAYKLTQVKDLQLEICYKRVRKSVFIAKYIFNIVESFLIRSYSVIDTKDVKRRAYCKISAL